MTKEERIEADKKRLEEMNKFQDEISSDFTFVFGVDEAGRGPLCGPVVSACTVFKGHPDIPFLNDSKKLSEKKRDELFEIIKEQAFAYGIGSAGPERIDDINILNATFEAMTEAYKNCFSMLKNKSCFIPDQSDCLILVDGNKMIPGLNIKQRWVIGGDAKCPSISAASILAKVTRDKLLYEYDEKYPEYGFAKHKGYGTKQHIEAIKKFGPLPIHRKSFIGNFI